MRQPRLLTLPRCARALLLNLAWLCAAAIAPAAAAGDEQSELVFLTWSEYMDPDLVEEFESAHNAKVTFIYFETDDVRSEMLVASEGEGYDLILTSGIDLAKYARRGWLATLDEARIPNLRHIEPRWRDAFSDTRDYGVPYFWGTLGIAYRADLVSEPIVSWKQLFRPPEALRGRIVMVNNARDVMGMALKALGYSVNSTERGELERAEELVSAQRPFVHSYTYVSLGEKSALATGDVWATMIYSGDALMLQEQHQNIAYVLPEEGSNLWVDYITVAESSTNKPLAMAFIDFLNQPRVAARMAEFVYYATPNQAAREYLPVEYFENPVIFPDRDQLARSEFYDALPARTQRFVNNAMSRLVNQRHGMVATD